MSMVPSEPGDYEVVSGHDADGNPQSYRFENVTFAYGDDGLRVLRGWQLVAVFRWWDAIRQVAA